MGEIIAFIVWTIVALFFVGIAISARKSKEPVGFFTGVKPPEVTDVKAYNRAVSTLGLWWRYYWNLWEYHFCFWSRIQHILFLLCYS